MKHLNKIIALLVGGLLGVITATSYVVYLKTKVKNVDARDIQHLDLKFGTRPTHPSLEPIVHLANSDGTPFCTAFVIDANYAATAGHCIEEGGKLRTDSLKFLNSQNVEVQSDIKAVGFDERTDFGLLKGDFNKFHILRSDFVANPFFEKRVFLACGYPFGQKNLACNPIEVVDNKFLAVRAKGFLKNGMSGGPVIDPNSGVAVGINYAINDGYSFINSLQGFLVSSKLTDVFVIYNINNEYQDLPIYFIKTKVKPRRKGIVVSVDGFWDFGERIPFYDFLKGVSSKNNRIRKLETHEAVALRLQGKIKL